jgi:hypothetical protein
MSQIAAIETEKAERLLKGLCNHFARKRTVSYEGNKGFADCGEGKRELTATASTLNFQAEADAVDGLKHGKRAVGSHLGRFAPDEEIRGNWKDPAYIERNQFAKKAKL